MKFGLRSIRYRLIIGFLVPVCGMVILGFTIYQIAASAITSNFEDAYMKSLDKTTVMLDWHLMGCRIRR